jgi:hypothetical protein
MVLYDGRSNKPIGNPRKGTLTPVNPITHGTLQDTACKTRP